MRREYVFAGTLTAVGVALGAAQLLTLAGDTASTTALVLRVVPMLATAAAVVYGGAWLLWRGAPGGHADRILAWTVGGGVTFLAVVVLSSLGRALPSGFLPLAVDAATGGSLVGLLVGVYDAQSRDRVSRIEAFARKVTAMNEYGKALNRTETLDGVSGLCVEAVEYLVAGDGAAFVLVSGDEVSILDRTLRGDQERRVLESLAEEIDGPDGIDAVRYAETGVDLGEHSPDAALVIPVPTEDGHALIVSLSTDADIEYDEEDVDLLETLAAHASTALAHVGANTNATEVGAATDDAAGD